MLEVTIGGALAAICVNAIEEVMNADLFGPLSPLSLAAEHSVFGGIVALVELGGDAAMMPAEARSGVAGAFR